MNQALLLPLLVPMFAGALLAMMPARRQTWQRGVSVAASLALLPVAVWLLCVADSGAIPVVAMGNWPAPFGIVLQLDRLGALMLVLTAVLAVAASVHASCGDARLGRHFDALFQFQLMGLNGAFLAGDLFNLFVFFEILLIASYSLLVHGGGARRIGPGLHYVLINLVGSSFFLIAIGILYGLTGTLNMVDMGVRLQALDASSQPLAVAGGTMLLLVFLLKAAAFPLYFWLPRAYAGATPSVAALFAVMTKVGVYAVLRTQALVFGLDTGPLAGFMHGWLWWLALTTMAVGAIGALAAREVRVLTGYLVLTSVGMLLAGTSLQTYDAWAAVLYYLPSTTLCTAALFLLAGALDTRQEPADPALERPAGKAGGRAVKRPGMRMEGALFLVAIVTAIGLPPMSGFIGKTMLLRATLGPGAPAAWPVILGASLLLLVAASRTGSRQVWSAPYVRHGVRSPGRRVVLRRWKLACAMFLLAGNLALVLFAGQVERYVDATAGQLTDTPAYRQAVLGTPAQGD
ncbi:monovalent cation/H+ antiporter subunit D [Cupriavidus agavae]|uniref:Multisubunit potassium/proton antiporter PhaD subunit n=1 Tax=Cupriavidus agavae TaxID=1001822 RepID=A0A4Q7RV78_9BURK|nr:monovalent cation/H+ antiporter subunit D [Cupriavidus agavae]RZT36887.1 multisubunit potassium/proton antiporter PhaD subunit [Cupriavidus agavae]